MKKRLLSFAIVLLVLIMAVGSCVSCFVIYPQFTTNKNNDIDNPDGREPIDYTDTFYLIDALFKNFSMFDVDYETAMLSAIRAYVGATGDRYKYFPLRRSASYRARFSSYPLIIMEPVLKTSRLKQPSRFRMFSALSIDQTG